MMAGDKGVAIVTGAGSGIGLAVAHRLAREGYAVVVNDVSEEAAVAAVASIAAAGGRAASAPGDVSREQDVADITTLAEGLGTVAVLVNNAGIVQQARFVDLTPADFDRMFAVHVRGTFLCMKAALPGMLERGAGSIVNMASQLGQIGGIELVHYSAAKSAIIGMTKSLAREVSAAGRPRQRGRARPHQYAAGARAVGRTGAGLRPPELPLGHFGEPEDIASTVGLPGFGRRADLRRPDAWP